MKCGLLFILGGYKKKNWKTLVGFIYGTQIIIITFYSCFDFQKMNINAYLIFTISILMGLFMGTIFHMYKLIGCILVSLITGYMLTDYVILSLKVII